MDPSIVVGLCSLCTLIGLLLGIVLWHYFGPASGGGVQGRQKRGWPKPSASYPPEPREMPVPRFRHDLGAPIEPACKRPHEHEARRCRMSRSEFESFLGPALSRNLCAEPDCPNVRAQASCYCEEHGTVRAATPPLCDLPRCTLNVVQGSTRCALHSDAEDPGVQVCTVGGRKHVLRDSPRMPPVVPPLRTDGESEPLYARGGIPRDAHLRFAGHPNGGERTVST